MSDEQDDKARGLEEANKEYERYLDERKLLIDAARESARTFDQAVLAFGSAIFAASIAFLKDVAPHPQKCSLIWLGLAWFLFSIGLLCVLLSFLLSHKACLFEIEIGADALGKSDYKAPDNPSSKYTTWCNYLCVAFLFFGLVSWSIFALENLVNGEKHVEQSKASTETGESRKRLHSSTCCAANAPSGSSLITITPASGEEVRINITHPSDSPHDRIPVHEGYIPPRTPPPPPRCPTPPPPPPPKE